MSSFWTRVEAELALIEAEEEAERLARQHRLASVQSLMKNIAEGKSDRELSSQHLNEHQAYGAFTNKNHLRLGPLPTIRSEPGQKDTLLKAVTMAGFELHPGERGESYETYGASRRIEDYSRELILHFRWIEFTNDTKLIRLWLEMPDFSVWYLTDQQAEGGLTGAITDFLHGWQHIIARRNFLRQLEQAHHRVDANRQAICALVRQLEQESGLTHNITSEGHITTLCIKLRYRRCLEIRLRPDNEVPDSAVFCARLAALRDELDALGNIQLCLSNDADTPTPTSPAAADFHGVPYRSAIASPMRNEVLHTLIRAGWKNSNFIAYLWNTNGCLGAFTRRQNLHGKLPHLRVQRDDKEALLAAIHALGFEWGAPEPTKNGRELHQATRQLSEYNRALTLRLYWQEMPDGQDFLTLILDMPDFSDWYLTRYDNPESVCAEMVDFLRDWQEVPAAFLHRVQQLRRSDEVSTMTIESLYQHLATTLTCPCELTRDSNRRDVLSIHLAHMRVLRLTLPPGTDLTCLAAQTAPLIRLRDLTEAMGNMPMEVRRYGNNVEWKRREAPAARQNEGT